METSWKMMIGVAGSTPIGIRGEIVEVGVDMALAITKHGHQKFRDEEIHQENDDGRSHHRLCGRTAHSLCAAFRGESVIAADRRDNKAKNEGFQQAHKNILEL